jgi:hypothetical protein
MTEHENNTLFNELHILGQTSNLLFCLICRQLQLEFITHAGFKECGKYTVHCWQKHNN